MHDVPAAEARCFDSHGYALIPGLFASNGLTQLQTWTDEVQAWPDTAGTWMKYYEDHMTQANQRILTRLENFEPYHEGFSKLFHVGVLGTIATRLLGEPAILFKDKINFKLPGAGGNGISLIDRRDCLRRMRSPIDELTQPGTRHPADKLQFQL